MSCFTLVNCNGYSLLLSDNLQTNQLINKIICRFIANNRKAYLQPLMTDIVTTLKSPWQCAQSWPTSSTHCCQHCFGKSTIKQLNIVIPVFSVIVPGKDILYWLTEGWYGGDEGKMSQYETEKVIGREMPPEWNRQCCWERVSRFLSSLTDVCCITWRGRVTWGCERGLSSVCLQPYRPILAFSIKALEHLRLFSFCFSFFLPLEDNITHISHCVWWINLALSFLNILTPTLKVSAYA